MCVSCYGVMTYVKVLTIHSWGSGNVSTGQRGVWGGGTSVFWHSLEQLAWCECAPMWKRTWGFLNLNSAKTLRYNRKWWSCLGFFSGMVNENLPHKNTNTAWLMQKNKYFVCLIVQHKFYIAVKRKVALLYYKLALQDFLLLCLLWPFCSVRQTFLSVQKYYFLIIITSWKSEMYGHDIYSHQSL